MDSNMAEIKEKSQDHASIIKNLQKFQNQIESLEDQESDQAKVFEFFMENKTLI